VKALVLGGGGVTGIAWETGLLAGLADAGLDLTGADIVVGTSAGSVVGAQTTSGTPLETLFARQLEAPYPAPLAAISGKTQLAYGVALMRSHGDLTTFGRRMGALAIKAAESGRLPSLDERFAAITARLPSLQWPERDLRITVVDAHTGEFRVLTRDDGVPLLEAVAASCAVPAVYPPVPIGDRLYIDGGVRTGANADVAAGCDRLVALTPIARAIGPIPSTQAHVDSLGVPAVIIAPDDAATAAIGKNALDPAARGPAVRAGRAQAASVVEQVRAVWA
jgi:NTE family protein